MLSVVAEIYSNTESAERQFLTNFILIFMIKEMQICHNKKCLPLHIKEPEFTVLLVIFLSIVHSQVDSDKFKCQRKYVLLVKCRLSCVSPMYC